MFFLTRLDQYYKLFSEKPFKHQIHPRGGKYRLRTSIFVFSFWFFYEVVDHLFPGFGSWLSSQIFLWRINWRRCWWLFVSGFSPASFKWKPFRWCSWSFVHWFSSPFPSANFILFSNNLKRYFCDGEWNHQGFNEVMKFGNSNSNFDFMSINGFLLIVHKNIMLKLRYVRTQSLMYWNLCIIEHTRNQMMKMCWWRSCAHIKLHLQQGSWYCTNKFKSYFWCIMNMVKMFYRNIWIRKIHVSSICWMRH